MTSAMAAAGLDALELRRCQPGLPGQFTANTMGMVSEMLGRRSAVDPGRFEERRAGARAGRLMMRHPKAAARAARSRYARARPARSSGDRRLDSSPHIPAIAHEAGIRSRSRSAAVSSAAVDRPAAQRRLSCRTCMRPAACGDRQGADRKRPSTARLTAGTTARRFSLPHPTAQCPLAGRSISDQRRLPQR
jgi:hypothetical protein